MGVGNGLRPDVWRDFQSRFGNIKMCEVYGSTEGNLCFMNHIGKIGTVGRSNFFYRVSVSSPEGVRSARCEEATLLATHRPVLHQKDQKIKKQRAEVLVL